MKLSIREDKVKGVYAEPSTEELVKNISEV